jgi:uncharacterized protein
MSADHDHDHVYADAIRHEREAKDRFFRESGASPLPHALRGDFRGLAYYPPDPRFRFPARWPEPVEAAATSIEIQTSDGATRQATRVGRLVFELAGSPCTLTAFRLAGAAGVSLFVPFRDATSGDTTYGSGRYLDIEPEPDGTYVLDFNVAYNPWCAYSPEFSCPLTPSENRLSVPVEAGERMLVLDV